MDLDNIKDYLQKIEEAKEIMNKLSSLDELQDKDFPGFFTVRKFVRLIDSTL